MKSKYEHALHFVKSKAISSQYTTIKIENDQDEVVSVMSFVEKMYPDSVVIVCQRSHAPTIQYVSPICKKIFGIEADDMMSMTFSDFLDLIHPEDIEDVELCYSFINSTEPYDPASHRFEMFYRLKHQAGHYSMISEMKMAIEDREGKFIYLNLYKDVSAHEKFHSVRLNLYERVRGEFKKITTYNPRSKSDVFTPRQNEIANFIRKGFTNEEIASRLHVSISTVKNHKNRLFKKAKVKTSMELASIAHSLS